MSSALAAVQHAFLPVTFANVLIPLAALVGIGFAIVLWARVSQIKVGGGHGVRSENGREYLLEEEQRGEDEVGCPAFAMPRWNHRSDLVG